MKTRRDPYKRKERKEYDDTAHLCATVGWWKEPQKEKERERSPRAISPHTSTLA